jgi:copper chaperone CopZ
MTCGGCSSRLKRVLEQADGVTSADITLETRQAVIHFDPARVNAAVLKTLVEDAGFSVLA